MSTLQKTDQISMFPNEILIKSEAKSIAHLPLMSLILFASYAAFGAILPAPALPAIAHYFHISASRTESVMFVYLIGYALGQLIYGPISNKFGRKTPLIFGIVISFLGSMLSALAATIHFFELLIIARFLLAIGAAASLVIGMILIKDCYDEINARRIFSKVVLTFALVPFIASALGGLLTHYFNWQALNVVLIAYALILLFLVRFIPETLPPAKRLSLSINYLLSSYKNLLKNSKYLKLIFLFSLGSSASYVFNALTPIVAVKSMHITAELYGYLSIIPSLGILIGGFVSTSLAHRVKAPTMIIIGISCIIIGSLCLGILFAVGKNTLIGFYIVSIIIFMGHALVIPNAGMEAQSQTTDHANGTSVMNAAALILSSGLVSLGGNFIDAAPLLTLPIILFCIGIVGILVSLTFLLYRLPIKMRSWFQIIIASLRA